MNPLNWSRDQKIMLLIAIVIGACLGIILGYLVAAAGSGAEGYVSFGYWVNHPIRRNWLGWPLLGGLMGIAFVYIIKLIRRRIEFE